jgi:hypothetical protein
VSRIDRYGFCLSVEMVLVLTLFFLRAVNVNDDIILKRNEYPVLP